MNRKVIIAILAVVGGLCACSVIGLAAFFIFVSTETPTDVRVSVDAPDVVPLNEPFLVSVEVNNLSSDVQILDSIDIQDGYLEGIRMETAVPPFSDSYEIPLVGYMSYTYLTTIPAGGSTQVDFEMVGIVEGEFVGDIDVCINNGSDCVTRQLVTEIGDGEGR